MNQEPSNLEEIFDRIDQAANDSGRVTLGAIFEKVGHRSYGVLLLLAGLITVAPIIGDIPGVPTIMGVFVLLTAGQSLFQRKHIWLPGWLLRRSTDKSKLSKALRWMRPCARFVDRFLRPRLTGLIQTTWIYGIALVCMAMAIVMPAMELVPFSANGAGAALTAFGLSLIARDGLLALLAYVFTGLTFGAILYGLL